MASDAKQYLISFLATLKGDKAVVGGLRRMESSINKTRKQMGMATNTTRDFGSQMGTLAKRALVTIPVWLLLRTVFMGLIRTVGDVIRSNVQFEEQLARIRTVMHGTAMIIDSDMVLVKSAILDMAVKSRLGIEKLAEGFYFLRTANLSTKQALEAFVPAVNLAVGTGNELSETTRALAGVYNTMGKAITDTLTDAEAFNRIADVLAFTYATQDVQLSELIASYSKFAPYVSGLDDSFSDVVTTLGFLNTRLLRAGRAGRLTGRSIIQLSKNADKLASIFGIAFDPDKPINFVDTMRQIHKALNTTTKLTEKQSRAIQQTFATRGAVPIRLLLESFEEWNEALELAGETAEGFAQKMNDIRMGTVSAQAQRLKAILSVLGNELVSGISGGNSFAETIKIINDELVSAQAGVRGLSNGIGFLLTNLARGTVHLEQLAKSLPSLKDLVIPFRAVRNFKQLNVALEEMTKYQLKLLSWDEYAKQQEKATEKTEEEEKAREKIAGLQTNSVDSAKTRTGELKKQKIQLANQVKLLKIAGAHEAQIAQFKLDQLDALAEFMTLEDEEVERLKLQNALIEAQAKFRKQLVTSVQAGSLNILKTMGASESQILEIKMQQLNADREAIGEERFLLNLTKLRQQQQVALLQEKQKEAQIATSLYLQYKKADEFERTRLRRLMELRQLSPEELGKRYKEDMFDQRVIDEYFSHFSAEGRRAVGEVIAKMFDLDGLAVPGLTAPPGDQIRELLNPEMANPFWDNWDRRAREALDKFGQDWQRLFVGGAGLGNVGQTIQDRIAIDQNVNMGTTIETLQVNIPVDSLNNIAENAGDRVKEALLANDDFQKKFIDKIRGII